MMTDVVVALAMPLIAMLVVYLTLHERAVAAAERSADGFDMDSDIDLSEPRARDWCTCGHTLEWHPSCARDVCGCSRFVAACAPLQQSESDAA